jgi:hypothetical protein
MKREPRLQLHHPCWIDTPVLWSSSVGLGQSRSSGSLHTQSWEDRESGQKRSKTLVRAEEVLFLDARQERAATAEAVEETVEDLPF